MSRILVTGGAGFIGSHLCEKLIGLGHEVISLDNFNSRYDPAQKKENVARALACSNYRLIEGDIRDGALLENLMEDAPADIVIHLAALAGVRQSIETPLEYVDVDIAGTVNLLELCKRVKVKKFVFASSSSVYGSNSIPFREDDPVLSQTSPYAVAKLAGEAYCRLYSLSYRIPTVCLRFFTVYGPRQRPDMAICKFTKAIIEGGDVCIFGDGSSSRDYTYVDDITDGIVAAAKLECEFEIINLGNSNPVNIMDLVRTIERGLGKQANIRFLPVQQGDVPITCADTGKAERLLGFKPEIPLEEGIRRYIAR